MKKKMKPGKKELFEALTSIERECPPDGTYKNTLGAFRKLIDIFPDIIFWKPFEEIYNPNVMTTERAEKILKTPKIRLERELVWKGKGRGISTQWQKVHTAENIIFHPEQIINKFNASIEPFELFNLLRFVHYKIEEEGKEPKETIGEKGYPKEVGDLIHYSLYIFYEVIKLFFDKWDIENPTQTRIAQKFLPKSSKLYPGKRFKGKNLMKDDVAKRIDDFRSYIRTHLHINHQEYPVDEDAPDTPDGDFYKRQGFTYLAHVFVLVGAILDIEREDRKLAVRKKIKELLQDFPQEDRGEILLDFSIQS